MHLRRVCMHRCVPLFEAVVLSVVLRNGDAHLKNFGLLYTSPASEDCRLSPLYDVICTTAYLPRDQMALKLAKTKAWPNRRVLLEYGKRNCHVADAERVLGVSRMLSRNIGPPAGDRGFG